MTFQFFDINGNAIWIEDIISYELISEADAPCDGLRLDFLCTKELAEICIVHAYQNGRLVFNGFCDQQKVTIGQNGRKCFIYARSSASLLVDNEAVPCQYEKPSARQLWFTNAREFGFKIRLPELYSQHSYLVQKGTSCYGAINDFVSATAGASVYVTPENELKVYEKSNVVKQLESYNVVSVSYTINRSEPISEIDYKINFDDNYSYHFKSDFVQAMGIKRKRLLNLSSIPLWQREMKAEKQIRTLLQEYYSVSAVIHGSCDFKVYDRVLVGADILGSTEEFYVTEITWYKNAGGEGAAVVLKKDIDGGLVNYVA